MLPIQDSVSESPKMISRVNTMSRLLTVLETDSLPLSKVEEILRADEVSLLAIALGGKSKPRAPLKKDFFS